MFEFSVSIKRKNDTLQYYSIQDFENTKLSRKRLRTLKLSAPKNLHTYYNSQLCSKYFKGAILVNSSTTVNGTPINTPFQSRRNSVNPDHRAAGGSSVKPPKFDLLKK